MQDLRTLFESEYPGKERLFEALIKPIFSKAKDTFLTDEQVLSDADKKQIKSFSIIAQVRGGFPIVFADVELQDTVALKRSRVNIQNCVRKVMENDSNAIIFFHFTDNAKEWRVSYVHRTETNRNSTSAKRYTYLCGPEHACRTVSERFEALKGLSTIKDEDMIEAFSLEALTEEFYKELFAWYEWACEIATFPVGDTTKDEKGKFNVKQTKDKNELNLIRLITRLMFVWFIKQKNLIPSWIFDEACLKNILVEFDAESKNEGNYYNAIIQNLFFATLNKKIEKRAFADDKSVSKNIQFGVKNFYRDNNETTFFKESNEQIIERFKAVPFLNGGLFECLDRLVDDKEGKKNVEVFTDGFSREPHWMAFIPNMLFWQQDDGKHEGLIHLLNRYNFTVEENSPTDIQVALDPELLGKVFENLLGTYNPETSETARKDSGSFYTPREIVSFMTDESIKDYLYKNVKSITNDELNLLFDDSVESFENSTKMEVVASLKKMKVLDPACGSGAFPMGALQRIIHLIRKCGGVSSEQSALYALKLELIEKCLYGIDIQPIAVQICKLRFFISLICEQEKTDSIKDNYGFNPLPNLETKFVAANSLIGITKRKDETGELFANPEIQKTKNELQTERHNHFGAPTAEAKAECRKKDKQLREKLSKLLQEDKMYDNEDAKQLAAWNPYDQNAVSSFFDAEWMFNIKDGFDIVIGNPPYIQLQKDSGKLASLYEGQGFKSFAKTGDIYCLFYEKGCSLLNSNGRLCFITSNKWMRAGYGEKLRAFFANNVNPKILVDFAGVKVFESATVDTNILLFEKGKNEGKTQSCTTTTLTKYGLSNLSDFVQQNSSECAFSTSDSWVVLSPIERSIKQKIEKVGVPLKDWDINIYRGVLTGFNDAFIISEDKKNEILSNCLDENEKKRTAEIIRPILRGRDIKRYGYDWAGLYLINAHNGVKEKGIARIDIEKNYPSIKAHLDSFWDKISNRTDKGDTPYNLRNCAYMDEFNKPKIVYPETTQGANFTIDNNRYIADKTCFILIGKNLKYLCSTLSSKLFEYAYKRIFSSVELGADGYQYNKHALVKLPVKLPNKNEFLTDDEVYQIYGLTDDEIAIVEKSFE
ncbi:MAG: N-6 DNA methylase [Treponema sp.]|nr:N-6 DNA methylase [Treponema sp.]